MATSQVITNQKKIGMHNIRVSSVSSEFLEATNGRPVAKNFPSYQLPDPQDKVEVYQFYRDTHPNQMLGSLLLSKFSFTCKTSADYYSLVKTGSIGIDPLDNRTRTTIQHNPQDPSPRRLTKKEMLNNCKIEPTNRGLHSHFLLTKIDLYSRRVCGKKIVAKIVDVIR